MAVEIEKFRKTYAGLAAALKECTVSTFAGYYHQVETAAGRCGSGENFLGEAALAAVESGVDQNDTGAMMKHPKVKEAIVNLNTATTLLEKKMKEVREFYGRAEGLQAALENLSKDIQKDLKSRSKSSDSRGDIVALGEKVDKDVTAVKNVFKSAQWIHDHFDAQVDDLAKTIKAILAKPIALSKWSAGKLERHKYFNERILNHSRGKVVTWFKTLKEECGKVSEALKNDPAKVKEALTKAKGTFDDMSAFVSDYRNVFNRSKSEIESSTEKDEIYKVRDIMYRGLEAAEKLFQETVNQVKEASKK